MSPPGRSADALGGTARDRQATPDVAALGRILVVVPTYNERDNLAIIAGRLRAAVPEADLLVVDDGSPDGTGEIADTLVAARQPDPRAAPHGQGRPRRGLPRRLPLGPRARATTWSSRWTRTARTQPEQLPLLLAALPDADLVLGSRWVPGGKVENWPLPPQGALARRQRLRPAAARDCPMHDATGGFRAYRRAVLEGIELDEVASQGYCFQVDLAWRAWRAGFRVVEVPITFVERVRGESKMSRLDRGRGAVAGHRLGLALDRCRRAGSSEQTNPQSVLAQR